jgi:hypothetical protein
MTVDPNDLRGLFGSRPKTSPDAEVHLEKAIDAMSSFAKKAIYVLVFASIGFFVSQWIFAQNVIFEIRGKQDSIENTIDVLLQERTDYLNVLLDQNRMLLEENTELRKQLQ